MRKLKWIDVTDVDTQHCLHLLNHGGFKKFGIENEADILSVQQESVEMNGRFQTTLWIFYWADTD